MHPAFKTFCISFSLKNTYRVNSILYSLKQVPLLRRLLPDTLYQSAGLKGFAGVLSALWEILSVFLWKIVYLWGMIYSAILLYEKIPAQTLFPHLLLFLSIIGGLINTSLLSASREKYYAVILLGMDARMFALTDFGYTLFKQAAGLLLLFLISGPWSGLSLGWCFLIPVFVVCVKLISGALSLLRYEHTGHYAGETGHDLLRWGLVLLFLACAYGLPAVGIVLPSLSVLIIMLLSLPVAAASLVKILSFSHYRILYQLLFTSSEARLRTSKELVQQQSRKAISADTSISSPKKGFEYLNDLFIRRHRKILWASSLRITAICLCLLIGALFALVLWPSLQERINHLLMTFLPYFVFIMYAINRGTSFTRALFMNCDHSLLSYSFYKQPKMVLHLFSIRLREIIKINLLPAALIGAGLALLLWVSGGTDQPLNYAILFVSIVCLSIFFSVHYLTIYYLLQPYNAGTEMKSATYQLILSATYLVCFFMMQLKMPTMVFGLLCIAFCILYCGVACFLIYRFAPKTFRLRP